MYVWLRLGACLASWKKQSMFSKFFELILMSSTQQILFPLFCIILPTNKKGITSPKASINLLTKAVFYFFYFFFKFMHETIRVIPIEYKLLHSFIHTYF